MRWPIVIGSAVFANWIIFLILLFKAQTPYGEIFPISYVTDGLLLLSCVALLASLAVYPGRWLLVLANALLITLWIIVGYAPAHWLGKVDFGSVAIGNHPVSATIYIGNPTDSEAEAVALVHIPAEADYFLSFGEERVRQAGKREYLRLPGGVWCLPSMRTMVFSEPLRFRRVNEFRIASPKGQVISIQF